jgi:ABC-type transport system substrate-binding protein
MTKHYQLSFIKLTLPPSVDDLKQPWHSNNIAQGPNIWGFANETADAIIEAIPLAEDAQRRDSLYRKVQSIIYEEQPAIFLYIPMEVMVLHKRFQAVTGPLRPGFFERYFQLKDAEK